MGLPASCLPSTVIEFLAASDPELVQLARNDARRLVELGYAPGFERLEDVPTLFFDLVRGRLQAVIEARSRQMRIGLEQAKELVRQTLHDRLKGQFEDLARYYHLLLNHEMAGAKIYRIAPALAERLLQTRINVPADALRLPFRSLMLVFDDDLSLAAFHEGRPFGRRPTGGSISAILFDLQAPPHRLLAASVHTRGRRCNGMFERSMRYGEGSLEAMLSTSWCGAEGNPETEFAPSFHRLLLNTLLYIISEDARITPPRRDHGAREPLTRSRREHRVVGDGLRPLHSRKLRESTRGSPRTVSGREMRQLVSGHWKLQHHGPGRSDRRIIWIEPYWRGPDFADIVNHARLVR